MRFCPQCGTTRAGNFCTLCGFAFPVEQVAAPVVHAIPAAWYPEPGDPTKERYWDGLSWTQELRHAGGLAPDVAANSVTSLLKYPDGFDESLHCKNCGFNLVNSTCPNCQ